MKENAYMIGVIMIVRTIQSETSSLLLTSHLPSSASTEVLPSIIFVFSCRIFVQVIIFEVLKNFVLCSFAVSFSLWNLCVEYFGYFFNVRRSDASFFREVNDKVNVKISMRHRVMIEW